VREPSQVHFFGSPDRSLPLFCDIFTHCQIVVTFTFHVCAFVCLRFTFGTRWYSRFSAWSVLFCGVVDRCALLLLYYGLFVHLRWICYPCVLRYFIIIVPTHIMPLLLVDTLMFCWCSMMMIFMMMMSDDDDSIFCYICCCCALFVLNSLFLKYDIPIVISDDSICVLLLLLLYALFLIRLQCCIPPPLYCPYFIPIPVGFCCEHCLFIPIIPVLFLVVLIQLIPHYGLLHYVVVCYIVNILCVPTNYIAFLVYDTTHYIPLFNIIACLLLHDLVLLFYLLCIFIVGVAFCGQYCWYLHTSLLFY